MYTPKKEIKKSIILILENIIQEAHILLIINNMQIQKYKKV